LVQADLQLLDKVSGVVIRQELAGRAVAALLQLVKI
jgi:hypothetical protein